MPGRKMKPGPGRPKGSQNKATKDVRTAFKLLVESNVGKFGRWLEKISEGLWVETPVLDAKGRPVLDPITRKPKTTGRWVRPPDPAGAMRLMLDVAEYVVPKLVRTEHVGENGSPLELLQTITHKLDTVQDPAQATALYMAMMRGISANAPKSLMYEEGHA